MPRNRPSTRRNLDPVAIPIALPSHMIGLYLGSYSVDGFSRNSKTTAKHPDRHGLTISSIVDFGNKLPSIRFYEFDVNQKT